MQTQANPGLAAFSRVALGNAAPTPSRLTPTEMAALGRGGDTIVSHLTPGEITIPPQMQTPDLVAAIQRAAGHFGVDPSRIVAGGPNASHNPATGVEEHDFWSSLIPMAAMAVTAVVAPEALPAEMAWAAPLMVGAAGGLSSLATGATPTQALITGAGGAAGGALGGLGSGAAADAATGAATGAATDAAATDAATGAAASDAATSGTAAATASSALPVPPTPPASMEAASLSGNPAAYDITTGQALTDPYAGYPNVPGAQPTGLSGALQQMGVTGQVQPNGTWADPGPASFGQVEKAVGGGMLGSALGQYLAPASAASELPANFNSAPTPPGPVNPNWASMLGSNSTITPQFTGYNPIASVTQQGYSFYPQQAPGQPTVAAQIPMVQPAPTPTLPAIA